MSQPTQVARPARRRGCLGAATILAATGLGLFVTELAVRWLHPMPFVPDTNMVYVADKDTGYRLAAGREGRFGSGTLGRSNAQGLRNRDVGPKPAGTFRILAIGDSFTMGSSVEQDEAYPAVLERFLAATTRRPVEVVNAGVGGWDPFQYAQYFARHGFELEPDLVVVGFFVGNDTYSPKHSVDSLETAVGGVRLTREAARRPMVLWRVKLLEHSHLARLFYPRFPLEPARASCADFSEGFLAIQRGRLANHRPRSAEREAAIAPNVAEIVRIRDLAARRGVPVVVALLPDETQVNPILRARLLANEDASSYDFSMPQSLLGEQFEQQGVRVLDLLPAFLADPRCLYNNTTHWNAEGQALAARTLAAELLPIVELRRVRGAAGSGRPEDLPDRKEGN